MLGLYNAMHATGSSKPGVSNTVPTGATVAANTFHGAFQMFLESRWGHRGLLPSGASHWPMEIRLQNAKKIINKLAVQI